jgi:hypothetical protein
MGWSTDTDQFHPLHVMPFDPLETLPKPLLRLIYPVQARSPGSSRSTSPIIEGTKASNLTAAQQLRDQMRKDMLTEIGGEGSDDEVLDLGKRRRDPDDEEERQERKRRKAKEQGAEVEGGEKVDWEGMVSGTKKVLSMDVSGLPDKSILWLTNSSS